MTDKKVTLVVGATSSIGRAVAERLCKTDSILLLAGRDEARLSALIAKLDGCVSEVLAIRVDIRSPSDVEACFGWIRHRYGRLDHLLNNAGVLKRKPLEEHQESDWSIVLETNVVGMWRCIKAAVPLMREGSAIVNTASVSGLSGTDWGLAAYVASKFAVVGLTKAAALELAGRGIRVNAVCPGVVRTDMTAGLLAGDTEGYYSRIHPLGRVCEPDEVAAAVEWLFSAGSSFVTGIAIPVDGGLMARVM